MNPTRPRADPLAWLRDEGDAWSRQGLERRLAVRGESPPGRIRIDGRSVLNFASNDYLGLASDPRVVQAATEAAVRYGWGSGASPLVSGWREPHEALAVALARFHGTEVVALFASGFAANLGTIAALVGPGDAVYADRLNHASLIDGARLAGARLRVFPHGDAERLASILARDQARFRRRLIATDSVFSMDGDLAPLTELADLADRFDAMLLVDEAHATGVLGPGGRGAIAAAGIDPERVPIKVGTLSKALGSVGGYVAGSRRLIDRLHNQARSLIYSTAPPPAAAAAALRALEISINEPARHAHLADLAGSLRESCRVRGLATPGPAATTPIIPWILGDSDATVRQAAALLAAGCLVPAIRPPTVPTGTARLRVSLTAAHAFADLEALLTAIDSSETRED